MAIRFTKKSKGPNTAGVAQEPPRKRRAGERAGVTMDKIVDAARHLIAREPGVVNIKLVAAELGVAHGSISEKLRRADTTLEKELTKIFLASILRPHEPGDNWKERIEELFQRSVQEGSASTPIARVVTPWIAQDPLSNSDFSDRLIYIFRDAGLNKSGCAAAYDVVLACLCGLLTVSFPDFQGGASAWSDRIASGVENMPPQRWPSLHYGGTELVTRARAKVPGADRKPGAETVALAQAVAGLAIHEIELIQLKMSL